MICFIVILLLTSLFYCSFILLCKLLLRAARAKSCQTASRGFTTMTVKFYSVGPRSLNDRAIVAIVHTCLLTGL